MQTPFGKKEVDWLLREKYPRFMARPQKYLPQIHRDLKRLRKGEPLAYVIGYVNFLGCKIDLFHRPLIPRPETEYWTEKAIKTIDARRGGKTKILDVFAGSGCIGIAVLKHASKTEVWFADNDPACLRQIRKNLKLNRIPSGRYKIKHSHILENVRMSFDYILANPPYIPSGRISKLPPSVRKYEKPQALLGGKDGLTYIRRFLREARSRLKPGGEIWLEFDRGQKPALLDLAAKLDYRAEFRNDQFGRLRYAVIKNKR